MVCRCSSPEVHAQRAERAAYASARRTEEDANKKIAAAEAQLRARTPDPANHEILAAERVGPHLVMKVRYPSCAACAFEGTKVLVYLNPTDPVFWRRIDPHFREEAPATLADAPSPSARFPATRDGWSDAIAYATGKVR